MEQLRFRLMKELYDGILKLDDGTVVGLDDGAADWTRLYLQLVASGVASLHPL